MRKIVVAAITALLVLGVAGSAHGAGVSADKKLKDGPGVTALKKA